MFHKLKEPLLGAIIAIALMNFLPKALHFVTVPHFIQIAQPSHKLIPPVLMIGDASEPLDSIYDCMWVTEKLGGGTCKIPLIKVPASAKNKYLNHVYPDVYISPRKS